MTHRLRGLPAQTFMAMACAMVLVASPAGSIANAKPAQSAEDSLYGAVEDFAAALEEQIEAHSDRLAAAAAQAAQRAIEDNKFKMDEAESEIQAQIDSWLESFNEEMAKRGMTDEEVAAQLEALKNAARQSVTEFHRSANAALEWFQRWLDQHKGPEESIQI